MKRHPFLSGLLAITIAVTMIAFKGSEKKVLPDDGRKHSASAEYYWYYVSSDGYIYSYSQAFTGRRTWAYAATYGACGIGNVFECMRGFVYPITVFPDNSYGDEIVYKATP